MGSVMGNIAEYDRRREWREKRVYNFVAANISQYGPSPVTYRITAGKLELIG